MERNYKLPKEGGLEPGADPADIIRKFEKIYTNIYENEASGAMYVAREIARLHPRETVGRRDVRTGHDDREIAGGPVPRAGRTA